MTEESSGFSMGWGPTIGTVAGLVLLLGLGIWQTDRYLDKKRRESLRDRRLNRSPVSISSLDDLGSRLDYRRVEIHGTIDPSTRIVVKHRHHRGDPGSWLVQPMQLAEGNGVILVNRGWIPFQKAQKSLDTYADPAQPEQWLGLLYRLPDVVPDDDNRQRLSDGKMTVEGHRTEWDTFDVFALYGELSAPTPQDPWVLVLGPRHTGDRYPIASYKHVTEPYLTSTRHLSYAVFWFAVAVALVGIYIAAGYGVLRRRRRGRGRFAERSNDEQRGP